MDAESFRQKLEARHIRLRRNQYLSAWSLVAGIYATILSLGLSGALFDIGFPRTIEHWFYVAWMLTAWTGSIALLASSFLPGPIRRVRSFISIGLWSGNLATVAGLSMVPIALPVVLLPLGVGVMLVRRTNGNVPAMIYSVLPLLASLCSLIYQKYGDTGI